MVPNVTEWTVPTAAPHMDPCGNYTEFWRLFSSFQPPYLALICAVGLVGNGLVLCVFCLQRKPCTVADVYLGNLAAADLLMVSCLPFWADAIARQHHWIFGEALCKLVGVAVSMNYYCSMLFLVLVSVDRYLALVRPMYPNRLRRPAWAWRLCLAIWLLSFLLSLPVLLFRKVGYYPEPGVDACYLAYPHHAWRVSHNIFRNIVGFLVPALVVSYCSYHIVRALKEERTWCVQRVRSERKATQLVLAVLLVFLVCWAPYQAVRFLDTLDQLQLTPGCLWGHALDIGLQLTIYLAYANSSVNPFLYVIVGKQFRRRAKEVFGKMLSVERWRGETFTAVNFASSGRSNDTQRISCKIFENQMVTRQ